MGPFWLVAATCLILVSWIVLFIFPSKILNKLKFLQISKFNPLFATIRKNLLLFVSNLFGDKFFLLPGQFSP